MKSRIIASVAGKFLFEYCPLLGNCEFMEAL